MTRLALYFIRHGQTTASREDIFSGARADPDLTPEGAEMAAQFAKAYSALEWQALYSSPLSRAIKTGTPISKAIGQKISMHDGLKELDYGAWDGKSKQAVEKEFHDDYLRWNADPAWNAPTGGETAVAVARRARILIEEVRQGHNSGNILLVSHKATIRIMLCDLLGIDLSRFRDRLLCPVGSLSVVEFGSRGPLLTALGDRSYQSEALRALPGT